MEVVNVSMKVATGNEEEIKFFSELVDNPEELLQWIQKQQNELVEIEGQMKISNKPRIIFKFSAPKRGADSVMLPEDKKRPKKKPKSEKKKVIKRVPNPRPVAPRHEPVPAAVMPGELMNAISECGGKDVVWVIEKLLERTDVNTHHARLSILESRVAAEEFLTTEERTKVSRKIKIPVKVLLLVTGGGVDNEEGPQIQSREFNFTKWYMNNSAIYVFITEWKWFLMKNNIEAGDKIQVWSFRRSDENKLCFAIHVIRQ
ncbi:uncharacterized protein LOC122060068 [Macadamia integrifolia]|uniref:uncharacterized protein LOC122060068 n=1 Tax=Macadamia integrifolia TaxID=60698 RepID=UPI001C5292B1|nr:uncharacterized protein LOC122060068 [Macadamia integrifolia]